MTTLFDDGVEHTDAIAFPGQSAFEFINHSSWPASANARRVLEAWFARYPRNHKPQLRGLLRSRDDHQHYSAVFELYLHELLSTMSSDVHVHPRVGRRQTRRPDFRVRATNGQAFYVEATTISGSGIIKEPAGLLNPFMRALGNVCSDDFFMEIGTSGELQTPPSARRCRRELATWLDGLDYDSVKAAFESPRVARPSFTWSHGDWTITFTPMPKGTRRGIPDLVTRGIHHAGSGFVDSKSPVRNAVSDKASAYGTLRLPFVIAVNTLDIGFHDIDLHSAMLGDERWVVTDSVAGPQAEPTERASNGIFWQAGEPRRRHVSAVAVFRSLLPWNMHRDLVDVYHNPWATHPLTPDTLPLRAWVPENGEMRKRSGAPMAKLLDLPEDWPGERIHRADNE